MDQIIDCSVDDLVTENIKLVYHIFNRYVKKTAFTISYKGDLQSEGILGLIKAAKTFDPTKNIKFATYASKIILNTMLMFIRKNHKGFYISNSLEAPITTDKNGNILAFEDVLEGKNAIEEFENSEEHSNKMNMVFDILETLPKRQKQVVLMYLDGVKQKDISEAIGSSQSYVSRLRIRAINNIKKRIKKEEYV